MHALKLTTTFLLLLGACGTSDSGTTAGTTTAAETGATAVTTTDASTGHATHATHDTHASEGSETGAATDTTHAHETDTHETVDTVDTVDTHATEPETTGSGTPVDAYCECMLENCHDLYHATWGEDHRASEAMCAAYAESVPSVGMPAMSGDSLECRLYFCGLGHDDPSACDSAYGGAPCQ